MIRARCSWEANSVSCATAAPRSKSPLPTNGRHTPIRLLEVGLADAVAGLLGPSGIDEEIGKVSGRSAASQYRSDIPLGIAEQTWSHRTLGGDSQAIAGAAEGAGDGRY